MNNKYFLVGMPGVGKTTFGKQWAQEINASFVDMDEFIVRKAGRSIEDIFSIYGEAYFRSLENEAILEILSEYKSDSLIVATGGGTPCFQNNMTIMKANGLVIWINNSIENIVDQLLQDTNSVRPLINRFTQRADLISQLQRLYTNRSPFYAEGHIKIDVNGEIHSKFVDILKTKNYL